jgi:hypothetical protein
VIFNLPGYRVIDAVDLPLGGRRVKVQPVDLDDGCPECGVISGRVHAWVSQRVRDIGHAGRVEVVVRKPRLMCARDWLSAAHVHPGDHSAAGESQVHHAAADRSAGRRDRLRPSGR